MTKTTQYKNWIVKSIGESVYTVSIPKKIQTKDYSSEGKYPIVDQGKHKICGYSNEEEYLINDIPLVMFGDHTKEIKYLDFNFLVGADGTKLLKSKSLTTEFLFQTLVYYRDSLPDLGYSRYFTELKNIDIKIPPLPEQHKIAEVLSTWDKAIQDTDAIIKKLEARNKALATSLLTGESRIEAFKNSPSAKLEIKDVAKEISLKNKEDHNYTVFSCTKYNGLVPSLEYFGKKIYSDNLKTYKIIKRNQFAYATNHIEEGSMGILEKEDIGLISPMYTIFEFNENVNLDYIFKMLKSDFYINEYKRRMEGSIDRRGGLRWSAFAQIKINLPSIEEQNAIAEILNTANQEVKQYQQKLEALKLQKKGLMQQLLTGKVRTV
ncbi:restriction endonuclease subunit S [Chryseobacterium sp. TY3]